MRPNPRRPAGFAISISGGLTEDSWSSQRHSSDLLGHDRCRCIVRTKKSKRGAKSRCPVSHAGSGSPSTDPFVEFIWIEPNQVSDPNEGKHRTSAMSSARGAVRCRTNLKSPKKTSVGNDPRSPIGGS
jgi:hypothetical protein